MAIHDSELTRALDSTNSPAQPPTPTGAGATGLQWWPTNWHYFVMPEAVKETLRSDGTAYAVVSDADISAGALLTNGVPKFPIVISLAAEAMRDDEIAPLTNYVAAGGFLLVGSSAFTRTTNGSPRGDFAFANELGLHIGNPGLSNWVYNRTFSKQLDHRLVTHIPSGVLGWIMASAAEEITWGTSPSHTYDLRHLVWQVQAATNATVVAQADASPYVVVTPFGRGYFIYHAGMQPLLGHSGWAPGMYAYRIFRSAIEWAFESARLPIPKLSPWPYNYDSAFLIRHDLENYTNEIADLELSARAEYNNGVRGDYYFCTGTVREDAAAAYDTNAIIASLRRAVSNYNATIGSHNGGLKNPNNLALARGAYDYWHWGPDEALSATPTNYPSGKAYASTSISNSFKDLEIWLKGLTNGVRSWVACYFNGNREDSYDVLSQLGVKISGEQKLGPFPTWGLSTLTPGKRYPFVAQPASDWYVSTNIAQSLEPWHPPFVHTSTTMHAGVDAYYNLGALINFYSHTLSTGEGAAGQLVPDYITYCLNTNLHPRLWAANAVSVYQWWLRRSNAQISVTCATNGLQTIATVGITGAADTNLAVEVLPSVSATPLNLQVLTNGILAGNAAWRMSGQAVRVRVGTAVTNVQVQYLLGPTARNDVFNTIAGSTLNVAAPGILSNDSPGMGTNLGAVLVSGPTNGILVLNSNGGFSYTPTVGFARVDAFTYQANDGVTSSSPASVAITVAPSDILFYDPFTRPTEPGTLTPWVVQSGNWSVTGDLLQGGTNNLQTYAFAYITNSWTNYVVEARVSFPSNAFGGGVGGRLNPVTGTHYGAWVYPEGSTGGSNEMKLVKFQNWSTFGYTNTSLAPMGQASLPGVGTNWHYLALAFQGNRVAAYYDRQFVMSVTDIEAQPYTNGSVSVDFWTAAAPYVLSVDSVEVSPLAQSDAYAVNVNTQLNVPAPGVLLNDTGVYGTNLTASLVNGPTNGTVVLNADGSFAYNPFTNFVGNDSFVYQASDGVAALGGASVVISVLPVNTAPVLPPQVTQIINGTNTLVVTNTATDADLPPQTLTYQLTTAPAGAAISTAGIITWSPSMAQVPSTNLVTTVVTDNGVPPLSGTNSFTVIVNAVHDGPKLPSQADRTSLELTALQVTNTASDYDIPPTSLTYALLAAPAGAAISPAGVITWTPTEAQGPSTNTITTLVYDNGVPVLSDTNTFTVVAAESNSPPVLPSLPNFTIVVSTLLSVTNTATDPDVPTNSLTYSLTQAPTNAAISLNGVISWTPSLSFEGTTNVFTTVVTDYNPWAVNSQSLSATNSFSVVVGSRPVIVLVSASLAAESCLPANQAIDPGETVTVLFALQNTYGLSTSNLVATLLATNGVIPLSTAQTYGVLNAGGVAVTQAFTFTTSAGCGATINPTLQLQEGPLNLGAVAAAFSLGQASTILTQNFDGVTMPALPAGWTSTGANAQPPWYTTNSPADTPPNVAFSPEAANVGINELVSPSFVVNVSQPRLSFRHYYDLEAGTGSVGYDGGVLEFKLGTNAFADILVAGGVFKTNGYNKTISTAYGSPIGGRQAWSGASGGWLTTLVDLPAASFGQTAQLRWRCATDNSNTRKGWFVDGIAVTGVACCQNLPPAPPTIQAIQVSTGLVALTWSAVTGVTYRVQYKDSLDATDWADVAPDVLAQDVTATATNAAGTAAARYYRVMVVP